MEMSWTYVWAVVLTGFAVVFLGLILLIIFVWALGKFFSMKKSKNDDNKSKDAKNADSISQENIPVEQITVADDDSEDEVAAVISAVVAMMSIEDGKNYKVKSVKPAKNKNIGGRPVWAMAGLRENTNPF